MNRRCYDRTKPTMSLTAFMVSPASFCARAEPSARIAVDRDRIAQQPLHLGADRAELGDGKIDQRRLEGRELRIAELASTPARVVSASAA